MQDACGNFSKSCALLSAEYHRDVSSILIEADRRQSSPSIVSLWAPRPGVQLICLPYRSVEDVLRGLVRSKLGVYGTGQFDH